MAYLGKTPSQAVRSRYYYTATGGETSLSGADDNSNVLTFTDGNYVDVSLNGVALVAGTDYNTTTTNTIGGLTALVASDVVEVIVYDTFSVFGGNMAANLNFKDNVKANFGDGSDLQIYHDASHSYIVDAGTGNLYISTNGNGIVMQSSLSENMLAALPNGAVRLYHDNAEKLATTATGVDVTGTVTADGLTVDTDTLYVDSTNNRVGIGTTSPDQTLVVKTADGGGIAIENAAGNQYRWAVNGDDTFAVVDSGTAERLRIDSSGNVLVGTTSYNSTLAGHGIGANGFVYHTRDNAVGMILHRKTSDGDIVEFRKDGTTVGSIGSVIGARLRVDSNSVAGYLGIAGTDRYYWNNTELGVNSDNAYNLGASGARFKDLWLSGGVYLGGTGSANYLDDYEEGTWTPVAAGSGGAGTAATYSTQIGTYTKIGRIVIMKFLVNLTSAGSEAGNARIAGFPFSGTTHTGLVRASTTNTAIVGVSPRGIYTGGPGNAITLDVKTGASTAYSELTYANFFSNTTSVLGEIIIEV